MVEPQGGAFPYNTLLSSRPPGLALALKSRSSGYDSGSRVEDKSGQPIADNKMRLAFATKYSLFVLFCLLRILSLNLMCFLLDWISVLSCRLSH